MPVEPNQPTTQSTWWHPLAALGILVLGLGLLTRLYHSTMPVTVPNVTPNVGQQQYIGATKRSTAQMQEVVAE